MTVDPVTKLPIKPCPYCGGDAEVEEVESATTNPNDVAFSVGCTADEASCYGYQSHTTFSRRSDAIINWNIRA